MPTINVLTFNVFENGHTCCGSLHGSLKPRQYLVSYLNSYPLTFYPASQKVCTDYLCQICRPIGLFSVGISSNSRIAYSGDTRSPIPVISVHSVGNLLQKTEDIHPPKTGMSVILSSSLGERNCKTSLFSRIPNRYHSINSPSSYSSSKCFTHAS